MYALKWARLEQLHVRTLQRFHKWAPKVLTCGMWKPTPLQDLLRQSMLGLRLGDKKDLWPYGDYTEGLCPHGNCQKDLLVVPHRLDWRRMFVIKDVLERERELLAKPWSLSSLPSRLPQWSWMPLAATRQAHFPSTKTREHKKTWCLRETVMLLRKQQKNIEFSLAVRMQKVWSHEVEDITDRSTDDEHTSSYDESSRRFQSHD